MTILHIFQHSCGTRTIARCVRMAALILVVLISVLVLAPQSGHASQDAAAPLSSYAFTVDTTADTHDAHRGDGVCADSSGQCSLRAATEEADALPVGSSITITVPAGTYALTLGTLQLTASNITINGAGSKTTIIKGNHTFTVLSISSHKMFAQLSQLMIEGGSAPNGVYGGGISNSGTLSITNSIIRYNMANNGGGIFNTGTLMVINSTLSNNSANNGGNGIGGGISNGGTLTLANSTLSNNAADDGGGGISNIGTLTVTHSTLSGNSATAVGGGILNYNGGTLSVTDSTLSGNTAPYDVGGGIYNSSTLSVTNSTLSNNSAPYGGGISNSGTLSVTNSTLSGNSAPYGGGGGIENYSGGTLTVTNSTLRGNSSNFGGGIENDTSTLTMTNSTLSNNAASFNGGGIENDHIGTLSVANSTLSGNSSNYSGGAIDNRSGTVTLTGTIVAKSMGGSNCAGSITEGVGYNLDSGTSCGFTLGSDLTNTNPLLGPLRNNGGPTQTMALRKGSKAIDWVAATSCPATDQRGQTRPDTGEPTCDIGAYESSY